MRSLRQCPNFTFDTECHSWHSPGITSHRSMPLGMGLMTASSAKLLTKLFQLIAFTNLKSKIIMNKNLLKTLLLTAAFAMGANSLWADDETTTYFSQDYESAEDVDWSTGTSGRFDPVLLTETDDDGNTNIYLSVNQDNRNYNGVTVTSTATASLVSAGTDFTMTFDMKLVTSTNQYPVTFTVYDADNSAAIFSLTNTGTYSANWYINEDEEDAVTLTGSGSTSSSTDISTYSWFSYQISRTGEITYLTITDEDGNTVYEQSRIATLSSTGGIGNMVYVTKRYLSNFAIDNVVIRSLADGDVPEITYHTITVKYVDSDGTEIADAETYQVEEGESFTPDYDETFDDDDYRYTYSSGSETIDEVTEDATITLVYTKAELAEYTVTIAATGDIEQTIATTTVKDGKTVSYYFPRYILDGTTLYQISQTYYNQGFNQTSDAITESNTTWSVTYTKAYDDVVYFSEAEDIDGLTATTSGNVPARCSNGAGAYGTDVTITTLPAGTYYLACSTYASSSTTFTFTVGDETVYSVSSSHYESAAADATFTISESSELVVSGGTSKYALDYVIVRAASYAKTIPSYGYVSFSAPLAVEVPDGVTVYQATEVGDDAVTLEEVSATIIPANEGVILGGDADDYTLTVTSDDTDGDFSSNILIASSAYPTVGEEGDGYTYYGLNATNTTTAEFAVIETGTELSGNKAYLGVSSESSAKTLKITFGSTTGISEAAVESASSDGAIYSLQGIKVSSPSKGLYIQDGKKVIIK